MTWAERLAGGDAIEEPIAVVVAHADDETLWTGSALSRLRCCTLVHLTDSAPRDMVDARRLGIGTRDAYRDLRVAELDRALEELDARPTRIGYGIPDQELIEHLPDLVERLAADCADAAAIVTHPYEGGHPDHDAAALAVRLAADRLAHRPALVEFACYHERNGERVFGRFWPDFERPVATRPLSALERDTVGRALRAHESQRGVFGDYLPDAERWRIAPDYDFTRPPPPGRSLYDGFGWAITSDRWRERAAAVSALA